MDFVNDNDLPDILTLEETVTYLRTTEGAFRKQLMLGKAPPSYRDGKRRKFRKSDVLAWVAAQVAA